MSNGTLTPQGDTTTVAGKRLRPGEFLKDASGNWFRVYDIGGGKLRLAPVDETGNLLTPKSQWKSPSGSFENELGQLIQTDIQGNITTSRTIPWSEWAGGAGGTAAAAPQWRPGELELEQEQNRIARERLQADIAATEQRLDEIRVQEAAADERQRRQLQAEREMLEMRLENSRRELVYSMGMQERGTLIQEKAETGREIMKLGPDPFRQAAILGGGVQRGTTPQQTAVGQAQAFMKQPLPQASLSMDVGQLEAVLSQMGSMQQPQMGGFGISSPGPFGMSGGGVIEMERGGDGAFSMKPKMSYLVGEGKHGEGLKAGTAEILTIGGGKVEVTPFGGGAYTGLEQSVFQGLSPLYSGFGFSQAPTAQYDGGLSADPRLVKFGESRAIYMIDPYTGQKRLIANPDVFRRSGFDWGDVENLGAGQAGYWDTGSRLSSAHGLNPFNLSQMGISPDLVKFRGSHAIYYRDPTTGQLRLIPNPTMFNEAGFNWGEVANMAEGTRGQFEFGSTLTAPPPPASQEGAFGALGTMMIESTTGAILPAVHKVARQLAQWKAAGDYRYDLAIQAYGNALDPRTGEPLGGISQQYIDSIVSAATPQAGAVGGRRIGFNPGGYM